MDTASTYQTAAARVISLFGGKAKMARALTEHGRSYVPFTTVQSWEARSGGIPAVRWAEIMRVGRKVGVHLTKRDFVGVPVDGGQ